MEERPEPWIEAVRAFFYSRLGGGNQIKNKNLDGREA